MSNVLIVGYGEIGQSIHRLYDTRYSIYTLDTYSKDIRANTVVDGISIDIMHICIPYTKTFIKVVSDYIFKYKPLLTVINSTIPLHTTKTIYTSLSSIISIVHSPVMGVHPTLTESIQTFEKIIGGATPEAAELAKKHFEDIGVKTKLYTSSDESEISKLFDTTYYGWNIVYMKAIRQFCKEHGLNFDDVYTKTNTIYNEGYTKMGRPDVIRPVLKSMPGKMGGHCVRPNAEILRHVFYPAEIMLELDDENSE